MDILNQWESDSVGKTWKFNPSRRIIRIIYTLAEKIAKKLLIDHGFNDSEWSQQKHTLQSAGKQIRKLFISKQSGKKNFEIDIEFDTDTGDIKIIEKISNKEFEQKPVDEQKESEPIKESDLEGVEDSDKAGNAPNNTISILLIQMRYFLGKFVLHVGYLLINFLFLYISYKLLIDPKSKIDQNQKKVKKIHQENEHDDSIDSWWSE